MLEAAQGRGPGTGLQPGQNPSLPLKEQTGKRRDRKPVFKLEPAA